jgi:hypothetical protein
LTRLSKPFSFPGILVVSFALLIACEESGVVGSSFISTDPEVSVTVRPITDPITTESLITYSGSKALVAVGMYSDPIFGTWQANAYVNPNLLLQPAFLDVDATYGLLLRRSSVTGDTTLISNYAIHEITQRWRANDLRPDSDAGSAPLLLWSEQPLVRFQTALEDSIYIPLPAEWSDRYLAAFGVEENPVDSYRESMFGFAIVPEGNTGRIEFFNTNESRLVIQNPTPQGEEEAPDPHNLTFFQRGSTYSRIADPQVPQPADRIVLLNDFSQTGRLNLSITDDFFETRIISRVELVIQEDVGFLSENLPENHVRSSNDLIRIFELDEDEKDFFVTKDPIANVFRSDDGRYRANLTGYVNNILQNGGRNVSLYIVSDQDNGIIRPNTFINTGDSDRGPRLIITSVNPNL